jgi:hypothetical protein
VVLGAGLAILANSRPFEGLIAVVPAGVLILVWLVRERRVSVGTRLGRVVLPVVAVMAPTLAGMAYYNARVTGNPLTFPYLVEDRAHFVVPFFLWQALRPEPHYNHPAIAEAMLGWAKDQYLDQRQWPWCVNYPAVKLGKTLYFYLGIALVLPLPVTLALFRKPWFRFAGVTLLLWASVMLVTTFGLLLPHYAAPVAPLLYAIAMEALRRFRLWRVGAWRAGRTYVRSLAVAYLLLPLAWFALEEWPGPDSMPVERAQLLNQLNTSGGKHLVLVRYRPKFKGHGHDEWVYNAADIDGSPVVWAREMGPEKDRALLDYFGDRTVWLLEPDERPRRLTLVRPPTTTSPSEPPSNPSTS